jgi:glycine/serine hydroxymethyltransferase
VNPLTGYIDYDKLLRIIDYDKCAGSSYLRELDYGRFRKIVEF